MFTKRLTATMPGHERLTVTRMWKLEQTQLNQLVWGTICIYENELWHFKNLIYLSFSIQWDGGCAFYFKICFLSYFFILCPSHIRTHARLFCHSLQLHVKDTVVGKSFFFSFFLNSWPDQPAKEIIIALIFITRYLSIYSLFL